ncbi:MAG: GNAT family N-acetyltransferase [Anaerolineales bacterium]|nr:GNAT family N-acetyltransferase [Chloroflexota bacterium]MBL6981255.1 GNAT family N-acetyltransferase [Anaerolineales bacterium]
MKTYTLRTATIDDIPCIRSLVIAGRINPTGLDWKRFVVALDDQAKLIGCGQIKPHRDGSHELASIAVDHTWRGRGVARGIIEDLIASKQGPLYLMCRSSLGTLYEKLGFRALEFDEMPKYFQRVSKLSSIMEILRKEGETLLVMGR